MCIRIARKVPEKLSLYMMVQQMMDSKLTEYGLGNTGTGFPTCYKQSPVAVKKTALRELQNDHRIVAPKPGNFPFVKEKGPIMDAIKVSGTKRPSSESPPSPPCHHSPSSTGAHEHLVYVRRKSEAELRKSTTCDNTYNSTDCPQEKQLSHKEGELPQQQTQTKGSKIPCFPAFAPSPMVASMTFSSGGPSVPHSLGKPVNGLSPTESNHPIASSANVLPVNSQGRSDQYYAERFLRLQTFLRNCDHSNQEEYVQMLRSLSSGGRNDHAVELEKRAIQLSVQEVNEVGRMTEMNVLGKYAPKYDSSPSTQQVQSKK